MPAGSKHNQPWPMKWIAVAIILIIVPYTIITLRYRKPGPAFQPYEDMKNRANVSRLLSAGYRRISVPASRPAEAGFGSVGGAAISSAAGGLPEGLRSTLVEPILLPADIASVTAASVAYVTEPYLVQITCTLPDDKLQLDGAALYVRDKEIVITPTFEPVAGELLTRTRHANVLLTVPSGSLQPGQYNVLLTGERTSRAWLLEVRK